MRTRVAAALVAAWMTAGAAAPAKQARKVDGYQDAKWGTSVMETMRLFPGLEGSDDAYCRPDTLGNRKTELCFWFEKGKLTRVSIELAFEQCSDPACFRVAFADWKAAVANKYGNPASDKSYDGGDVSRARWDLGPTQLLVTVRPYKHLLHIIYSDLAALDGRVREERRKASEKL